MTSEKYYNSPGDQPKRPMPRPNTKRPMPRPTEPITRGTPEQGADMFKRQEAQLSEGDRRRAKRALEIDPDNYTPSRD